MAAADDRTAGAPGETEGFVRRWSRRKQEVQDLPAATSEPPAPNTPPVATVGVEPPRLLTDADMPPLESLGADSDFSGFLSPGVSEALRRAALRRLFALPDFSTRCPLDSEFYDCTGLEPLGDVVTHEMRAALEREAAQVAAQAREVLLAPRAPSPADEPEAVRTAAVPVKSAADEAQT